MISNLHRETFFFHNVVALGIVKVRRLIIWHCNLTETIALSWRNDRVYVKIVMYSSVTPLSEGKMVMNE